MLLSADLGSWLPEPHPRRIAVGEFDAGVLEDSAHRGYIIS